MKKEETTKVEEVKIVPLKNFTITHNDYHIELKEGVSVPVPRLFLQNMVTEGVIKELPKKG